MTRHCDKHDKHDKHKCKHRCCYDYKKLNVKHLKTCDLKVKKDVIIEGDLTVKGTTCLGQVIELEPVEFPMEPIPNTVDPINAPFQGSVEANGLTYTYIPSGNPGLLEGPWYFTEKEGTKVLQCGIEEDSPFYNGPDDEKPPISGTLARVEITKTDPIDPTEFTLNMKLRWSTEIPGSSIFDYLQVTKNDEELFTGTSFNQMDPSQYLQSDLSANIATTDKITVHFIKDQIFRGGWDSIYFYISSLDRVLKNNTIVKGDLCVEGCIKNLQLELLEDCFVPPTDEVYSQQTRGEPFSVTPVLATIEDPFIEIPPIIVPGTETDPGVPVYGYNGDGTLDINGGPPKSYNSDQLDNFSYRYHGNADAVLATEPNMTNWMKRAISYSYQRGLAIPGLDVIPEFEGQYLYYVGFTAVAMKFHYESGGSTPSDLDIIYSGSNNGGIDLYEQDENLWKNGRSYPIRVPITTSFKEFKNLYDKEPIVFYDLIHRKIVINFPDNGTPIKFINYVASPPFRNENTESLLVQFKGTFSLMRRDANNQLILSNAANTRYLVQSSTDFKTTSITKSGGNIVETDTFSNGIIGADNEYSGIVCPLMNGESGANDSYCYFSNNQLLGASERFGEQGIWEQGGFAAGDNPVTSVVENMGFQSGTHTIDTLVWKTANTQRAIDPTIVTNSYPETIQNFPNTTVPPDSEFLTTVTLHELNHGYHFSQGLVFIIPTEGICRGFENDRRYSNQISGGQVSSLSNFIYRFVRAQWPLLSNEFLNQSNGGTYAIFIFWLYYCNDLQFDPNWQSVRRMLDILSNETAGPAMAATGVPSVTQTFGVLNNPAGNNLALQQSMNELFGKSLQDVFADFCVSLTMLRNNTSIPVQYRTHFPFWMWSANYPGNQELIPGFFPPPIFGTFWDVIQNNVNNGLFPGTPFPVLDNNSAQINRQVTELTCLSFEIDGTTLDKVRVTVNSGEWKLAMLQFTSDGTPVGVFSIDGLHDNNGGVTEFDVTQFVDSGYIRMVCAHVSIINYGPGLDNFVGFPQISGNITIDVVPL